MTDDRMLDLLLAGGHVYVDGTWAQDTDSIGVRDGVIVSLGRVADLQGLVGPETTSIDLAGRWVLPGFQDAHVHPVQAGLEMDTCDLSAGGDAADYLAIVSAYAADHPDEAWIVGGGWSMEAFPRGLPTAVALDEVVGDRPVFLPNRDHHSAWVSSAALRHREHFRPVGRAHRARHRRASDRCTARECDGARARSRPARHGRRPGTGTPHGPGVSALVRHHGLAGRSGR